MSHPRCDFCFRRCAIAPGQAGFCGVRANHGGDIVTESRNQAVSLAVDPVEKKPLYHVQPGSMTLSVALFGCNYRCRFCQNASISQPENRARASGFTLAPGAMAERMEELGLGSVSFTYSEPTVWQDWMLEAAQAVKERGGRCFMVTNGSFTPEARARFAGLIDAYNIDVKGDEAFYAEYCGGSLEPVLENVRALCRQEGVAVEVCTLLIEGVHRLETIVELGERLRDAGLQVWHLSRFFPAWKMLDTAPSSEEFLDRALEAVRQRGLVPFCYAGNSSRVQDTRCPACRRVLIARGGGRQGQLRAKTAACPDCGTAFPLLR
jgi:pyruvate formate lyase activating enzyme